MSDELRAYLAQRLTQHLGAPDRTGSGQTVWVCRYGDEPALATVAVRATGVALRLLQAPDGSSVEVCAVKYLEVPDTGAADAAVAVLTKEPPA